jgi:hypothetical protein
VQTIENNVVSLRALDGGLADLEIRAVLAGTLTPCQETVATMHAIERIARASGAGIPLCPDPLVSEPAVADPSPDQLADVPPGILGFETKLVNEPRGGSHSITRIRAFDPIIRARLPSLDVAIVTDHPTVEEAGLRAARPTELVPAELGYDEATVDRACRYALRFGRQRVQLLTSSRPSSIDARTVARLLDTFSERYPGLEIETLALTDVVRSFLSGSTSMAVMVAGASAGDVLREMASALSGVPALTTVTCFSGDTITAGVDTGCTSVATTTGDQLHKRPSALVLSLADLLVWLGREEAATRILNGWCRTVEHGCHTEELSLMHPGATRLDADELADAVIARLASQPRSLKARFTGSERARPRSRAVPHLHLV